MNQTATIRTSSLEITRARPLRREATGEKAFSKHAFMVIVAVFLAAWILTG
jgi:hypothetical protein